MIVFLTQHVSVWNEAALSSCVRRRVLKKAAGCPEASEQKGILVSCLPLRFLPSSWTLDRHSETHLCSWMTMMTCCCCSHDYIHDKRVKRKEKKEEFRRQ